MKLQALLIAGALCLSACNEDAAQQGSLTAGYTQLPLVGSFENPAVMDMHDPTAVLYEGNFKYFICMNNHVYFHSSHALTPVFSDAENNNQPMTCPRNEKR